MHNLRTGTIQGKWQGHSINEIKTNFQVSIDKHSIHLKYINNDHTFPYKTQGNKIEINVKVSDESCAKPGKLSEKEVTQAFGLIDSYELSLHSLVLKSKDKSIIVLVRL